MKLKPSHMAAALAAVLTAVSASPGTAIHICAADSIVCINEICSQNKAYLADSYGVYSDWIELYNPGSEIADLSGCGLSDDAAAPLKFTFPEGTKLGAGERLMHNSFPMLHTDCEVMNMAKQGMKRPENTHTKPRNEAKPVPEIQGKAKHGKLRANPLLAANDLALDNLENDLTAADMQDE